MNTRTFGTGNPTTNALFDRAYAFHAANGTDVRCPTCNAPAGRFCVVPGSPDVSDQYRTTAPHEERLVLAAAQ